MSTPSDELIERVVEVTGASADEAKHLLGACNNDVESAVALYFEQGGGDADAVTAAIPTAAIEDEDNVRAPIAPRREQLIGPEDDNFLAAPSERMQRMNQRVKVCPFRDFAREGALMEEEMQADATGATTSSSSNEAPHGRRFASTRAASMATTARAQKSGDMKPTSSRLGDLFRPPTDITFAGTFQAARARAQALSNWLLVNVQDDNFNSQVLNRDVWSNKEVRQVIKRRFLLWQVDSDTSEGRRFSTFYHCADLPYVCVVDPRTGEEMWKCIEPKESNVLPGLRGFITEHKEFLDDGTGDESPSTSKRTITVSDDEHDVDSAEKQKRLKLLDLTEEEQINLAIRNSMRENGNTNGKSKRKSNGNNEDGNEGDVDVDESSEFESIEDFGDEDSKSCVEPTKPLYETQLGKATEELTALRLRLLNAEGNDEVVQLRWPSDTLLKVLRLYIGEKHTHVTKNGGTYKLICAFPRKTLEAEHDSSTIKELGLHPSANLHITLDE